MTRWARFGVLELGLLGFAIAAWRAKGQLTRQMSLTLCAAMLGPLLAVYGQTYQTGADPYELFLTWALLAAPLAALSRFMPLWTGVWALLNLSLSLACEQLQPLGVDVWHYTPVLLAALNAAGVVIYALVSRKTKALGEPKQWPLRALALAAVLPALPQGTWYIADWWPARSGWGLAAALTVAGLSAAFAIAFRSDRFVRSSAAFAACGLGTSLVFRVLKIHQHSKIAWLAFGLIIVLETTLAVRWIRGTKAVAQ